MSRPRAFDTDIAIERLCDYFWEHGYNAGALDDLAKQLGVKRGSLFNAFGSKEVLFNLAFDRYRLVYQQAFNVPEVGKSAIEHYFHNALELITAKGIGRGCFFINLLMAAEVPTPELQQIIDRDLISVRSFFTEHLNRARLDGELGQNVSISAGVDALFGTVVGLSALARIRATPVAIAEFINNNLRGVFGSI
jgi:TetR/AcrR family transcriptional regulator, transcriptional repressor for nem operon